MMNALVLSAGSPYSRILAVAVWWFALFANSVSSYSQSRLPDGWTAEAPREELRPAFEYKPDGGPTGEGGFVISHDARDGLDGWLQHSYSVVGGRTYHFEVYRRHWQLPSVRRNALVRIVWKDEKGSIVPAAVPATLAAQLGHIPTAEPEHPVDHDQRGHDQTGTEWTKVEGTYEAPPRAKSATVELHLQWAPRGRIEWSLPKFIETSPRGVRRVRLATIHYRPSGKSPLANCQEYVGLIEKAASQGANLVVLGETVPFVGVRQTPAENSETIPGPTTEFFGQVAKKNSIYIVLSLYERKDHLVFNTAILLDPTGALVGKYHKVCLPHAEVEKGVAPGNEYPVFETQLGKIGMMVCYDGFFPEVARELANHGAEIIAWPVWGCNPILAQARAAENHVYVVSSTYTEPKANWMLSAVYDPYGNILSKAENWGDVVISEVDLNRPAIGPWNLGDFHSMIPRHRPMLEQSPSK